MFQIRESDGQPESYAVMAEIMQTVAPANPVCGTDLSNEDLSHESGQPCYRWIGWQDDIPVGFFVGTEETWDRSPDRFSVYAALRTEWQGQGLGRQLWTHGLQSLVARHRLRDLTCETHSDQARGIRFLQDRGFALKKESHVSELAVTGYDLSDRLRDRAEVLAAGMEIRPLSQIMKEDPDWFIPFHDLCMEFQADMVHPPSPLTLEEHRAEHELNRQFDPSMTFVVIKEGKWLAFTALWPVAADPTLWWTSLTGVCRAGRRKGLASVLKTTAIEAAQQRGGIRIRTDNDLKNPMFSINQAFGFQLLPAAQTWLRSLPADGHIPEDLARVS